MKDGRPFLLWLQLRQTQKVPTERHLGMLARLFLVQAARMGHSDIGLLIADMRSSTDDTRDCVLLSVDDLLLPSEAEAEAMVQDIAHAYDALAAEGFDPKSERAARRGRHSNDRDLFSPSP